MLCPPLMGDFKDDQNHGKLDTETQDDLDNKSTNEMAMESRWLWNPQNVLVNMFIPGPVAI